MTSIPSPSPSAGTAPAPATRGKQRRRRRMLLRVGLAAMGALLLAVVVPAATGASRALAQGSSVTISPTQGPPGTVVTATGSNWTPGDQIQAIWNGPTGTDVGSPVGVNSSGGFALTFAVPSGSAAGSYQIAFYDETERTFVVANEDFTVSQSSPSSSPPAAPSNVSNSPLDALDFYISWQINSTNQTGFQVYNGVTIENVGANQSYYEWAAHPNQYMCIAVRAYNSSGYSAWAGTWTCASTPGVQAPPTGKFTLSNYNSGCLGVLDGADNNWAVQGKCNTPDQTWTVGQEDGTTGYYQLVNDDNECLGVYDGSTASNADVVGWQCLGTGHPDQYWAWVKAGVDGSYDYLVNYNSGQVLGVYDNLTSSFAQIVQSANQESLNSQLWQLGSPGKFPALGTGPGASYCTGYPGGAASYSFDNVYACEGTTTGATTFDNPGSGVYAWQCVELSARFLWATYNIWAGPVPYGYELVSMVHANYPGIQVGTPGPGSVPVAGDVISLGPYQGTGSNAGHTAVVISANQSTGQFEIMSENAPENAAGEQSLQVDLTGGHNGEVLFFGVWTTASWLETGA
jgi:Ricin-type beta-trefoil lectin domain-like